MLTWDDMRHRIDVAVGTFTPEKHFYFPLWVARSSIVIMGPAGAGKTDLWRRMTGKSAPERRSAVTEDGYSYISRRTALALTTIPGQESSDRFQAIDAVFNAHTRIAGVIFVAHFGYQTVWPEEYTAVSIQTSNVGELRQLGVDREALSFASTLSEIRKAYGRDQSASPKWLLVLVNKADLYWSDIDLARDYYAQGTGSLFDNMAQDFLREIGGLTPFVYQVLPVAVRDTDYAFATARYVANAHSQLSPGQCEASVAALAEVLGELNDNHT